MSVVVGAGALSAGGGGRILGRALRVAEAVDVDGSDGSEGAAAVRVVFVFFGSGSGGRLFTSASYSAPHESTRCAYVVSLSVQKIS